MGDSQTQLKRAGAAYPLNSSARLTKFEAVTGIMRRALVMVMLLFLPAVNAMFAPSYIDEQNQDVRPGEMIVEIDNGVWTHQHWDEMGAAGIAPLRVLSPTQLLAWGLASDVSEGYTSHPAPDASWRVALDGEPPMSGESVRILIEPRLPVDAYLDVRTRLSALGVLIGPSYAPSPLAHVEEVVWPEQLNLDLLLAVDGILWIEPVLETRARNIQSAALMQHGALIQHPAWQLGINGAGVVVGVADSGLDADHACFRNATVTASVGSGGENGTDLVGSPSQDHRKVLILNTTIDSGDTQGHADYRHGTHVAGTLSCFNVDDERSELKPSNGSALAHGTMLVFQDIVSEDGWVAPDVDDLLVEAGLGGAVIHSNSWGDDTTAYTARTSDFDAWALAMPWSLAFIAPGNTGSSLLEPANGRNVAAIGASMKSEDLQRWSASSIGPTEAETNGIFALAVGASIQSAKADNLPQSYNSALRTSTGTSMATPGAAGVAALIQQLVEEGWISGQEPRFNASMASQIPEWEEGINANSTVSVGQGFTPSGPMLRSLLALSTTHLPQAERNGGDGGYDLQNTHDGWGQLNLSELIDFSELADELAQGHASPADNIWIHDAYRLVNGTPDEWLAARQGADGPLENLMAEPWNGSGAVGPFLQTGETWIQRFTIESGVDFDARMAHIASPEPTAVNDLQLVARLSDGRIAVSGVSNSDGSATLFYNSVDLDNSTVFAATNETTHGLRIDAASLDGVEWIEIEVRARFVTPGNVVDGVGLDGTRTGFSLALKGVIRDAQDWVDADGDGVVNIEDECPNQNAEGWDENKDGCLDDDDQDGVTNNLDQCPDTDASQYDNDSNGCIDDSDGDGVGDDLDACITDQIDVLWPVDSVGCRPLDASPEISDVVGPPDAFEWDGELTVRWSAIDQDGDAFVTGAHVMVLGSELNSSEYSIAACELNSTLGVLFECTWNASSSLPLWNIAESQLRIDVYVQSSNASPEGNNDRILIQTSNRFSAKYDAPFEEIEPPSSDDSQGAGSQTRALFWGVLGAVMVGLILYRIGAQTLRPEEEEGGFPHPSESDEGVRSSSAPRNDEYQR